MNTHMLENPITQDNLKTLEHYGFTVIPSGSGLLACGDTGSGRLPDEGVLVDYVARELEHEKDMQGMKVVVSAGGTREPMDPVRYLTNHSTGKMGYAVARACMLRGADVTLLAADVTLETSGSAVVLGTSIPLLTESAWDAVAQLLQ